MLHFQILYKQPLNK